MHMEINVFHLRSPKSLVTFCPTRCSSTLFEKSFSIVKLCCCGSCWSAFETSPRCTAPRWMMPHYSKKKKKTGLRLNQHRTPRAMRCKQMGHVDVNGGVHTTRKQHQRKNNGICRVRRIPRPVWIGPKCLFYNVVTSLSEELQKTKS